MDRKQVFWGGGVALNLLAKFENMLLHGADRGVAFGSPCNTEPGTHFHTLRPTKIAEKSKP